MSDVPRIDGPSSPPVKPCGRFVRGTARQMVDCEEVVLAYVVEAPVGEQSKTAPRAWFVEVALRDGRTASFSGPWESAANAEDALGDLLAVLDGVDLAAYHRNQNEGG